MDTKDGWLVHLVRCVICTHQWVAVYPVGTDDETLTCPNCGGRSSEKVES